MSGSGTGIVVELSVVECDDGFEWVLKNLETGLTITPGEKVRRPSERDAIGQARRAAEWLCITIKDD